ncbi:intraflagellar transport protein 46 homolog [Sceloporus undulatus]|uniref:intraflagellar transport protein 46 homolog n=1 Tax=Sceloporus undulatus TaxID=8520 RepID=UPI001C4D6CB9|nr:intraflagellar transport protein 46 homolog [Sceloporus undulatus]
MATERPSPGRAPERAMSAVPPSPAPLEASLQTRLVENQPYDESLEVNEAEEVASLYAPSPPQPGARPAARGARKGPAQENSSEEEEEDEVEQMLKEKKKGPPALGSPRRFSGNEVEDEDEDSSETDSEDDEDDDDEHGGPLEGTYNPADFDYLPVPMEVKELFQYIRRYSPQMIELEHKLKPFIPDMVPAVGDIDAFIKVPRPDGKPNNLGLLVLDEPSIKQSDPTVLSLWLTENSKQHNVAQQIKVKSLENAEKNPKAIDNWIESITELHRCKPPATVHYARPMPDIETLMQEWPPEFEELLGKVNLPTANHLWMWVSVALSTGQTTKEHLDPDWQAPGAMSPVARWCSWLANLLFDPDSNVPLGWVGIFSSAILDIPVYKGRRIQSLHTLFSLYSEFKNSQHFKALAEGKKAVSPPSNPPSQAGESDILNLT